MTDKGPKIARAHKTIEAMIRIYCHGQHGDNNGLCSECQDLLDYAKKRLDKCPLGEDKPSCGQCTIHCYKPDMRTRISAVMRYAGPRMMRHHPVLTMQYLADKMKTRR